MRVGTHNPQSKTVTVKAKSKKRYTVIVDESLISLMRAVGRKIDVAPGAACIGSGELSGVFFLPTNNVLEIYVNQSGQNIGYLFVNLDVWMSFGQTAQAR